MVTPELKWPTTNLTPSPTNLLATETPCLGSDDVVAEHELDLLAVDAARGVDVLDGLLGAVLELRAERGVGPGERTGDADLDLRPMRRSANARLAAMASAGQNTFFIQGLPFQGKITLNGCLQPVSRADDPTKAWRSHADLQTQVR